MSDLTLVSHPLCPYVQRAAIALTEKNVPFRRIDVDLSERPDWFRRISPLGKVPLLMVARAGGEPAVLFESAVILDYLEETSANPLLSADPLQRAEHRAWIAFGSAVLDGIAGFYSAKDEATFEAAASKLADRFGRLEAALGAGPWFAGERFGLVDAAFAPVFRYFDAFEAIGDFEVLSGKPKIAAWRRRLAARPSVVAAVAPDYPDRLRRFLLARQGVLAGRMRAQPDDDAA